MSRILPRKQFGDPILRQRALRVSQQDIQSPKVQQLIRDMHYTLKTLELGVALAAPQVGQRKAIVVIRVRPLAHRPTVVPLDLVLINPQIVRSTGGQVQKWEGCISSGEHDSGMFAKVPRYRALTVRYQDEYGRQHTERFSGLPAQIIQHEVDHLAGILFVDRVTNTKTFVTYQEYLKMMNKQ